MEYERKGVTIDWQIQNLEYICLQKMELCSPVISVDEMDGTKWKLVLHEIYPPDIKLAIKREREENGPKEFGLDYQFFVNPLQRPSSTRTRTYSCRFKKGHKCPEVNFSHPDRNFDSSDTIIIRCKIWRQKGSICKYVHFSALTRMATEHCSFVGVIENFSDFSGGKKILKLVSSSTGEKLMTVNLILSEPHEIFCTDLEIQLIPIRNQTERRFKIETFILDSFGNKTDIGKVEREFTHPYPETFTLPNASKEELLELADLYLPNDTLSLQGELTFCSGKECESVESIECETDYVAETKQTDLSNKLERLTTREGIPFDTKIQTATETFHAHTDILSSQSPVFEVMFKTNMKEAIQKCVRIDDVDPETVKRMLVFLYSGTLDKLMEWKDAMELYFIADKYQVLSLRQKCSKLLKRNIDLSNCCVLLYLADIHQDKNLKINVQTYIVKNSARILHCDQWKNVVKTLPLLANETLSRMFV